VDTFITDIAVSGSDIYFSGYTRINGAANSLLYWKNGTATNPINGKGTGDGTSVAISGSDVYIVEKSASQYWKNGAPVNIPSAYLRSIFVAP
jgi:hypothetical protein